MRAHADAAGPTMLPVAHRPAVDTSPAFGGCSRSRTDEGTRGLRAIDTGAGVRDRPVVAGAVIMG